MQKILTIVVPVFKVEQYINKCLDSCIIRKEDGTLDEKMMDRLEVIIVNDGTPDRSAEMSREYTVRYPQTFRQIDQENRGHGGAWNTGLEEATGKYLRFLDSDDWLTNLDLLMEKLTGCDSDLVFTDYVKVHQTKNCTETLIINSDKGKTLPLTVDFLSHQYQGSFILNFWHTTYKTSILQSQVPLFAEHVMYDDSILGIAPLLYGRTYIYYKMPLYNYLIGRAGQSMDTKVMSKNIGSYHQCYERQVKWMNEALQKDLPSEYVTCIRKSVQHYAGVLFEHLIFLPYYESKKQMASYYQEGYASALSLNTWVRRYERLPFIAFWIIERVRSWKKHYK